MSVNSAWRHGLNGIAWGKHIEQREERGTLGYSSRWREKIHFRDLHKGRIGWRTERKQASGRKTALRLLPRSELRLATVLFDREKL